MVYKIVDVDIWTGILIQVGQGIYKTTAGDELFKPKHICRNVYLIETGVILENAILIHLTKRANEGIKNWSGKPVQQALFIAKTDLNLMKKAARKIKIYKPIKAFKKKRKFKPSSTLEKRQEKNVENPQRSVPEVQC